MTTGNLELRIGDERLYAFTSHDGYRIHHALQRLIEYQGEDYAQWFRITAPALLLTIGDRLTAPDHRAVIDAAARRIDICSHYRFPAPQVKAALTKRRYRVIMRQDGEFFHPTRAEMDLFMEQVKERFP